MTEPLLLSVTLLTANAIICNTVNRECKLIEPQLNATNDEAANRLWDVSLTMCGIKTLEVGNVDRAEKSNQ